MEQVTVTVLKRAAELVERGWCQGAMAKDAQGCAEASWSELAVSWCMAGAIERAAHEAGDVEECPIYRALRWHLPEGVTCWNDGPDRQQAEVVDILRRAARLAAAGWTV